MNHDKYLTVASLTKYLKHKFDSDMHLRNVFLKGEISNLKKHSTGHYYFSIKDESSKINAIMFSSQTKNLNFSPEDGMKVLLVGRISVYESTGSYQIYVEEMLEDGVGNLYVKFEQLKKDLAKEGLFDEIHKKRIPKYPTRVGIVTAPTGAAIKDILSTIQRRFPSCETLLFPSLVQGENAAPDIVKKIKMAEEKEYHIDVLIVGRGGGSIEDMWPFNEEIVARAIYNCPIPIISAVGHEVDFTIADFVADLRAPTPTGAAEMAVPSMYDLEKYLKQISLRIKENVLKKVKYNQLLLERVTSSFVIKNPVIMYENKKQYIDTILEKLKTQIFYLLENKGLKLKTLENHYLLKSPLQLYQKEITKIQSLIEKLEIINPLGVLKRGYSLAYKDKVLVKDIKQIQKRDRITIVLENGKIDTEVVEIMEEKHGKRKTRN
ncbi:MAG: exodeoxyribonuclease VII large subunit [Bacilli bacterium]|nr:exodeoxyribonuclease VII large subunit [Bacilli bacterium]